MVGFGGGILAVREMGVEHGLRRRGRMREVWLAMGSVGVLGAGVVGGRFEKY